jgi:hypothetical protein
MIRIVILFPDAEARALAAMGRNFQFGDAQHLLRHSRNIRPDNLNSAVTRLFEALTATGAGSRAGTGPESRVPVILEIESAELATNRRFLEALLTAMSPQGS